jgi:hypothetical protein
VKVRVLASPKYTGTVLSSSSLAAGSVIAIVKEGLATGYSGAVEVSASDESTLHFEDAAPLPIVDGAGVVARPVFNAFQMDLTVLKIRGDVAWTVHPGAIAWITQAEEIYMQAVNHLVGVVGLAREGANPRSRSRHSVSRNGVAETDCVAGAVIRNPSQLRTPTPIDGAAPPRTAVKGDPATGRVERCCQS